MKMAHTGLAQKVARHLSSLGAEFVQRLETFLEKDAFLDQDVTSRGSPKFSGISIDKDASVKGKINGRNLRKDGEKLDKIQPGAQVNVNPDWKASSGDAFIKNKPKFGSMALEDEENYIRNGEHAVDIRMLAESIAECLTENQEITISGDASGKGTTEIEVKIPDAGRGKRGLVTLDKMLSPEEFDARIHFLSVRGAAVVPLEMDGMHIVGHAGTIQESGAAVTLQVMNEGTGGALFSRPPTIDVDESTTSTAAWPGILDEAHTRLYAGTRLIQTSRVPGASIMLSCNRSGAEPTIQVHIRSLEAAFAITSDPEKKAPQKSPAIACHIPVGGETNFTDDGEKTLYHSASLVMKQFWTIEGEIVSARLSLTQVIAHAECDLPEQIFIYGINMGTGKRTKARVVLAIGEGRNEQDVLPILQEISPRGGESISFVFEPVFQKRPMLSKVSLFVGKGFAGPSLKLSIIRG